MALASLNTHFHPFSFEQSGPGQPRLPRQWTSLHWLVALVPGTFFAITNYAQNAAIAGGFAVTWRFVLLFALFLVTYNFFALTMRAAWAAAALIGTAKAPTRNLVLMHAVIVVVAGPLQMFGIAALTSLARDTTNWAASIGHYFSEVVISCTPIWIFAYVITMVALGRVAGQRDDVPETAPPGKLDFRDAGQACYVDVENIVLVEAHGNYVRIVTTDRNLMPRVSISALEAALPDAKFIRTHRSAIVRKGLISAICRSETGTYTAVLSDGRVAPISRRRLSAVRKALAGRRAETVVTGS